MRGKILLTLIALLSLPSMANVNYSIGTYVPYFNQAQVSTTGAQQTFATNPYIGIGKQFHLAGSTYFMPELGYAYYLDTGSNYNKDTVFLHYNFGYVITKSFIARYGLSNHWYRIIGNGGSQRLSNGNGSTTFPSPNKTVTTHFTTVNLGLEGFFSNRSKSVRLDLEVMNSRALDERGYNYLLTFNFYL